MLSLIIRREPSYETLGAVLTEVKGILDNGPLVLVYSSDITHSAFTHNYLSAMRYNRSFMELLGLRGIHLHGGKQATDKARVLWRT